MHRLFTVRWPLLARLEAVLLFVAILPVWNKLPALQSVLDDLASVEASNLGIPKALLSWGVLAFLAAGPYLGAMLAVDRVLRARNGFALLSVLAIATWAGLAALFATDVAALLPAGWVASSPPLSFAGEAVIGAASIALLIHARPLAMGLVNPALADRGLAARPGAGAEGRRPDGNGSADQHPGPWGLPNPQNGTGRAATGGSGALRLMALAGVCAVALLGLHFHASPPTGIAGMQQDGSTPATSSRAWAPAASSPLSPSAAPADPWASVASIPMSQSAALPQVWTPAREAAAARRPDGSFGVEAVVNHQPISMLFDTGASWVTLRAEDAARLGIDLGALRFSIQSRTANGVAAMAPVTIDTMSVGQITVRNVPAVVARPGTLEENLLGQSFLARLRDYSVASDRVIFHGN
jgi:clan AA aspartic protease (TIGR02281 family)